MIRITSPDGQLGEDAEFSVRHELLDETTGFALDSAIYEGIAHTFSITLEVGDPDAAPDLPFIRIIRAHQLVREDVVTVARLEVREYPVYLLEQYVPGNWQLHFDAVSLDVSEIMRIAEAIRFGAHDLTLDGGSVFYFESVDVHPIARGNQLAARLMRFAALALHRHEDDLVATIASPGVRGCFDPNPDSPEQAEARLRDATPERLERLVRYYNSAGFERWDDAPPSPGTGVLMYLLPYEVALAAAEADKGGDQGLGEEE